MSCSQRFKIFCPSLTQFCPVLLFLAVKHQLLTPHFMAVLYAHQASIVGGNMRHLPPPLKISKHCIGILKFAETFKEWRWNFIFDSWNFYILILKFFRNAACVYTLILFPAYLLRKRVAQSFEKSAINIVLLSHQWSKVSSQETTPGDRNSILWMNEWI